mgnify:FL=1
MGEFSRAPHIFRFWVSFPILISAAPLRACDRKKESGLGCLGLGDTPTSFGWPYMLYARLKAFVSGPCPTSPIAAWPMPVRAGYAACARPLQVHRAAYTHNGCRYRAPPSIAWAGHTSTSSASPTWRSTKKQAFSLSNAPPTYFHV